MAKPEVGEREEACGKELCSPNGDVGEVQRYRLATTKAARTKHTEEASQIRRRTPRQAPPPHLFQPEDQSSGSEKGWGRASDLESKLMEAT